MPARQGKHCAAHNFHKTSDFESQPSLICSPSPSTEWSNSAPRRGPDFTSLEPFRVSFLLAGPDQATSGDTDHRQPAPSRHEMREHGRDTSTYRDRVTHPMQRAARISMAAFSADGATGCSKTLRSSHAGLDAKTPAGECAIRGLCVETGTAMPGCLIGRQRDGVRSASRSPDCTDIPDQWFSACTISSVIFFASPNSIIVFGRKNSTLSTPAYPDAIERFTNSTVRAFSTSRIGIP